MDFPSESHISMSLTGVCDERIYVYTASLRRFGYELQLCVCVRGCVKDKGEREI